MNTVITHPITKWLSNKTEYLDDCLAVEEPLEIRLEYLEDGQPITKSIAVTMRTPGNDFDLATGFLYTEGILSSIKEIVNWECCGPVHSSLGSQNVIKIRLADHLAVDLKNQERNFCTTSSCGVCGKSSLEAIEVEGCRSVPKSRLAVPAKLIKELPERARIAQQNFSRTGGIHATALFNSPGDLLCLREDVGRHNAMDKMVGDQLQLDNVPLSSTIVLVSGRASFELIQKAAMAGVPIFVAVGAPSSLAVSMAIKYNITLVGFANQEHFNVYCGEDRVEAGL